MINSTHSAQLKSSQRLFNTPGLLFTDIYQKKLLTLDQLKSYQNSEPTAQKVYTWPETKTTILKQLAKDITKPIWPCQMTFTPNAVYSKFDDTANPVYKQFQQLMEKFIFRFKNQHQDQSTLKINIEELIKQRQKNYESESNKQIQKYTSDLLDKLQKVTQKKIKFYQDILQNQQSGFQIADIQNHYSFLSFTRQILTYFANNKESWSLLIKFQGYFDYFLSKTEDSQTTSTLFTYQPLIKQLSLVIHPLLLCINHNLKTQIQYDEQKKKKKQQKKIPSNQTKVNQMQIQNQQYIFPQIKSPCSKLVFINLDGYQSQFSIEVAKYYSKYLMYISFPKQSTCHQQTNINETQRINSQRLLNKYFMKFMQQKQKQLNQKMFKSQYKQLNKNLFVFPIHSSALVQNLKKKQQNSIQQLKHIQLYESNFIYYLFKQVLFNQIRQFNPAVIIVSYTGKIFIQNKHFIQIIKQLTILSNYKLIFFPNMTKSYMFIQQQKLTNIEDEENYQQIRLFHQTYYQYNQSKISFKSGERPNVDLLQKISVFLKISSGTYNLLPSYQQQSFVQKYKNSKILYYAANLINLLSPEYPTIDRIRFRSNQLISISKVIQKSFGQTTYTKLFENIVPRYYKKLTEMMKDLIKKKTDEAMIDQKYQIILSNILRKYDVIQIQATLKDFIFQFQLQIATQKYYSNNYLIIKNKKNKQINRKPDQKKNTQNLYAVQFQYVEGTKRQTLMINQNNKILYDKYNKQGSTTHLVYVMNYLNKQNYQNYVGKLDQKIINQNNKIKLQKVQFNKLPKLQQTQILCDWNYHESKNYIFLYWPQKFDFLKYILCKLEATTYIPQMSDQNQLIYRANRNNPNIFQLQSIQIEKIQFLQINPKYGCTAYSIQNNKSVHMYVFGGFYHDQKNYMKFQNQITKFEFKNQQNKVKISPIGKSKKIQAVRPRLYYEIRQLEKDPQNPKIQQIHLIGGYGKNFSRPYTIICTTFYHIQFNIQNQKTNIERLYRLSTNAIQINVPVPIKVRGVTQMNILKNAQGRQFYLQPGVVNTDGYCFHHNNYTYTKQQGKLAGNYDTVPQFEFGQVQRQIYKQQINDLKKPSEQTIATDIQAKYYRGNKSYYNFITIIHQTKPYVFQLQFQIPHDVRQKHQTLPEVIHLTGQSIISLDITHTVIFALIKHPVYTLNKCILAQFDMSTLSGAPVSQSSMIVKLHEIFRIKQDVSKHIIIAVNLKCIAILHGPQQKVKQGEQLIPQLILKKSRTTSQSRIKQGIIDNFSEENSNKKRFLLSSSLFMKEDAIIHCFSFRTINKFEKILYYNHSKLNLAQKQYKWQTVLQKPHIQFSIQAHETFIKSLQLFQMKKTEAKKFDLKFIIDNKEYKAQLNEQQNIIVLKFQYSNNLRPKFKQMNKESIVLDKRNLYSSQRGLNQSIKSYMSRQE